MGQVGLWASCPWGNMSVGEFSWGELRLGEFSRIHQLPKSLFGILIQLLLENLSGNIISLILLTFLLLFNVYGKIYKIK
jgi:hypothetical protein